MVKKEPDEKESMSGGKCDKSDEIQDKYKR